MLGESAVGGSNGVDTERLINSKETTRYPTYEKIYMEEKGTQKLRMRKRGGWGTIGKTEEQGEKLGGVH
jgi:hypothetical protein